jgi:hypothetical protein
MSDMWRVFESDKAKMFSEYLQQLHRWQPGASEATDGENPKILPRRKNRFVIHSNEESDRLRTIPCSIAVGRFRR